MKWQVGLLAISLFVIGLIVGLDLRFGMADASKQYLSHDVFFSLKDKSEAKQAELVDLCKRYLASHPGTVFFSAGTLAKEFDREVNDLDFDVALHVVFDGKESHDKYQTAPDHLTFIEKGKDNWEKVRVFDSYVELKPTEK
jgi:hypothetical protein